MIFSKVATNQITYFVNKAKISEKKRKIILDQITVLENINPKEIRYASDGKYTIITDGSRVGVAKRTTYPPKKDKENFAIGFIIALSRMLKN